MRLLLIEDDALLGEGLHEFLAAEGHAVRWCRSLGEVSAVEDQAFDAWLVDWQLPDGSGRDWVAQRRRARDRTPALMLTARDRLDDRIAGLDAGADDYLVKPFAPEELAARLRAVQRRQRPATTFVVGEAMLDLEAHAASTPAGRVELTAREWTLVEALAQRAGRVVAKSDLEQLVLGAADPPSSNALEVHVSSLRRKLGRDVVETVRGLGYRLGEISR
jgi:two-component system OmpR family response regulator